MRLIVGLGNPGKKYENTRHNLGFLIVDTLIQKAGESFSQKEKFYGLVAEFFQEGKKNLLLKPTTFMNRSGQAVKTVADYYKIDSEDIVVIHDDADLNFGDIKLQSERGAAGHRGVQSIIDSVGNKFTRIRVGVGRSDNPNIPLDEFVLQNWTNTEEKQLPDVIQKVITAIKNNF